MAIIPLLSVFVVFHAATTNVAAKDEILYLGDSTVVLQCSIPDALSTSWFVFNQPFPDSLLTGTCSVLGSGTQMQCSVSRDLDNVTLRCEADDGSQTHSRIYRIYVEAPPRAVSNITMTGSNISWEPLPSRARVERSHVDILFNGSTVLYSTNTTGTSNSIQLVREDLVACLKGCSCSVNVVVVFEKKQSPATELQVPQCLDSSQTTSESPTEQPETTAGEDATSTDPSLQEVTQANVAENTGVIVVVVLVLSMVITVFLVVLFIGVACLYRKRKQRGQFEPERLSYSTPTRPATQSPNTEESAGEESESDQSQGQFVSGTGKPTVTRRLIPLNQTHRCTSLTGGVSPGPKEHVELSLDNGGGAVPFPMFDPSELPATPPAKPPKDPQVFLVGSGTIADDQVNSQPVFQRSLSAPSGYKTFSDAVISVILDSDHEGR